MTNIYSDNMKSTNDSEYDNVVKDQNRVDKLQ